MSTLSSLSLRPGKTKDPSSSFVGFGAQIQDLDSDIEDSAELSA